MELTTAGGHSITEGTAPQLSTTNPQCECFLHLPLCVHAGENAGNAKIKAGRGCFNPSFGFWTRSLISESLSAQLRHTHRGNCASRPQLARAHSLRNRRHLSPFSHHISQLSASQLTPSQKKASKPAQGVVEQRSKQLLVHSSGKERGAS